MKPNRCKPPKNQKNSLFNEPNSNKSPYPRPKNSNPSINYYSNNTKSQRRRRNHLIIDLNPKSMDQRLIASLPNESGTNFNKSMSFWPYDLKAVTCRSILSL